MTEPDDGSPSRPEGDGADGTPLPPDEAAAVERFGTGPARFSPDVPAPRRPPTGPLRPDPLRAPRPPSTDLVAVRPAPPAVRVDAPVTTLRRVGDAARDGIDALVFWSVRGAVAAVTALGAAAHAVVGILLGPDRRPALSARDDR